MKSLIASLAVVLFLGVAVSAVAQQPAAATGATHITVVSYFHGDIRCATCKKLEAWSRAAVEKAFAKEIAAGQVVFRTVNTDRAENAHFLKDYSLVTKALVVTEEANGKVLRWKNLDRIWELVRGDERTYDDYVTAGVRELLASGA